MAEDKRIRVSADTTPLRQLREEAISLYREIERASSSSEEENERSIQQLREQLSLMNDRNELEKLLIELKKQSNSLDNQVQRRPPSEVKEPVEKPEEKPAPKPREEIVAPSEVREPKGKTIVDEDTNSITWDFTEDQEQEEKKPKRKRGRPKKEVEETESSEGEETPVEKPRRKPVREEEKETLREINRHVENIDNSVTNVDNSKKSVDNSTTTVDNSQTAENNSNSIINRETRNENLRETVVNIDRNTQTIKENTTVLAKQDPVEVKPTESRIERREIVEPQSDTTGNRAKRNDDRLPQEQSIDIERLLDTSAEIVNGLFGIKQAVYVADEEIVEAIKELASKDDDDRTASSDNHLQQILQTLIRIDESTDKIEEKVLKGGGSGGGGQKPPINPQNLPNQSSSEFLRGIPGLAKFAGQAGLIAAAVATISKLSNTIQNRALRLQEGRLRQEYMGSVDTYAQTQRINAANEADLWRLVPLVGGYFARQTEMKGNVAADRMVATLEKYFAAEGRNTLFTQTFGGSAGQSMRTAFQQGGYAANALGVDVSTFLNRNAELTRAAGGKALGSNEYDQYGWEERRSTLSAEKLFGISPSAINALQGSLRFGERNNNYGSSGIIRSFEKAMQELHMPFREIASTMEESLATFNKRAENILEKAGDFDAGRVAAVMNAVRVETSFQGRRLERFQDAYSGSGISEDETTQALLLRTLTRTDPGVKTYSEAMEKLEQVRSGDADPEFMRNFLLELQGLSQNNEQFINILKGVFPNLSFQDIRRQFDFGEEPGDVINRIFNRIAEDLKNIRENPNRAYEATAAEQVVGTGAKIQAADTNRQIGMGADELRKFLTAIRDNTARIPEKDVLVDFTKNVISHSTVTAGSGPAGNTPMLATPGVAFGEEILKVLEPLFEKLFRRLGLPKGGPKTVPEERE